MSLSLYISVTRDSFFCGNSNQRKVNMNKKLFFLALLFVNLITEIKANSLSQTQDINGETTIGINVSANYTLDKNDNVLYYKWISPIGCKIVSGQGTENITIRSSFLSQDSELKVIREFTGNKRDTLKLPIYFHRPISIVQDHKIALGESITIAGIERNIADIYYEQSEKDGNNFITAHRLTVEPRSGIYLKMTKPYLQTVTSNSVWICWKTDYESSSKVMYGANDNSLDHTKEGNFEKLSDAYYWHSVQLTDLTPNTLYTYKIQSGEEESEIYRFKTAPQEGSKAPLRILLMGDHQIKSRSGYEWLMQAAKRKIEEKYGKVEENIDMIMNVGDQVDVGTLDHYEHVHLLKSELLSPYLSIMTAVGNHETYNDPGMVNYASHFHYEDLQYQGISSGSENYYAYQIGRLLFIVLSTEHTGNEQKAWVRKVVDAAKQDDNVDFIISVNHRPIQAEQYIGDISAWVRNEIVPILSETDKHVFNYGGHHHLYHRGQWNDAPFYHIINGAASWDQMWGMSSEKDYDDVQKTIDYWGYQIMEFDFEKKEMEVECYAIGNKELVVDNILIDKYHRRMGKVAPDKPEINQLENNQTIKLPFTFCGSEYSAGSNEELNTTHFQIATSADFSNLALNVIRDIENLYGSTGKPFHIPVNLNEGVDITKLTVDANKLKNGTHYLRIRYRDENLEWSSWSEVKTFTVEGSINGDPVISVDKKSYALNESINISFEFVPEGQNAWIGVYRKGMTPGSSTPSVKWTYTNTSSGIYKLSLNETNEYYAVLFEDEGYTEISSRIPFYVGEIPVIQLEKTSLEEGEAVKISYTNAPGLENDWIGIYKMGEKPGKDYSDSWLYTEKGTKEGEMMLSTGIGNAHKLSKGYYFINYFTCGEYFEPGERQYISVGKDISALYTHKNNFDPDEDITVYYSSGPGTPKDWIGVFKEGKVVGIDELDGFYYTYGETDGEIIIPAGELNSNDYFLAFYINDSYDEVSPRIHISIGKSPQLVELSNFDEYIVVGFETNEKWMRAIEDIEVDGKDISKEYYKIEAGSIFISRNAFPKDAGFYNITVKSKAWQDTSIEVEIKNSTSLHEVNSLQLKIYPVPVSDVLYIETPEAYGITISIIDAAGTICLEEYIQNSKAQINVEKLVSGTYLLLVKDSNTQKVSTKIIIKE